MAETNNVMKASDTFLLLVVMYHLYVLFAQPHACSKDSKIPVHRLTTDGGECGSPTGNSEGSQPKIILLSTSIPNSFRSRCDQDPSAVKPLPKQDYARI